MNKMWNQKQAIAICKTIEAIAPKHGCHVALTGGLLYKEGDRKDCDLLFYRIRQVDKIDVEGLFEELSQTIGMVRKSGFDWCIKAELEGRKIDCFFPESSGEEYERSDQNDLPLLITDHIG